jgi:hypothetical protein
VVAAQSVRTYPAFLRRPSDAVSFSTLISSRIDTSIDGVYGSGTPRKNFHCSLQRPVGLFFAASHVARAISDTSHNIHEVLIFICSMRISFLACRTSAYEERLGNLKLEDLVTSPGTEQTFAPSILTRSQSCG